MNEASFALRSPFTPQESAMTKQEYPVQIHIENPSSGYLGLVHNENVIHFLKNHDQKNNRYKLTTRELEILQELSMGFSQKEIGARLYIEPSTVNTHIQHIYEKLKVRTATGAVAKGIREGLIE